MSRETLFYSGILEIRKTIISFIMIKYLEDKLLNKICIGVAFLY